MCHNELSPLLSGVLYDTRIIYIDFLCNKETLKKIERKL